MIKNLLINNDMTIIFSTQYINKNIEMLSYNKLIDRLIYMYLFNEEMKVFEDIDKFYNYLYENIISILLTDWYKDIFFCKYNYLTDLNNYTHKIQIIRIVKKIVNYLTDNLKRVNFKKYDLEDEGKIIFFNEDIIYDIPDPEFSCYIDIYSNYREYLKEYESYEFDGDNYIFDSNKLIDIHNMYSLENNEELIKKNIEIFRRYGNELFT